MSRSSSIYASNINSASPGKSNSSSTGASGQTPTNLAYLITIGNGSSRSSIMLTILTCRHVWHRCLLALPISSCKGESTVRNKSRIALALVFVLCFGSFVFAQKPTNERMPMQRLPPHVNENLSDSNNNVTTRRHTRRRRHHRNRRHSRKRHMRNSNTSSTTNR